MYSLVKIVHYVNNGYENPLFLSFKKDKIIKYRTQERLTMIEVGKWRILEK